VALEWHRTSVQKAAVDQRHTKEKTHIRKARVKQIQKSKEKVAVDRHNKEKAKGRKWQLTYQQAFHCQIMTNWVIP
jgi:hypothetical protein